MDIVNFPYNEYKYLVTPMSLPYVIEVLESLHGHSDPYPEGIVDSIYYDTADLFFYQQCLNGENDKRKFRIRGYGDDTFHQMHMKDKDLFIIRKLKDKIKPARIVGNDAPSWYQLEPASIQSRHYFTIMALAAQNGSLLPALRVRYHRRRYRINDYRLTLDTHIEVSAFTNGLDVKINRGYLAHHVLEIKTVDRRPYLPLLGLARLPQISFSKFFLGLNLLRTGEMYL